MPTTTRLALALFVAVILALTFYAYPSWSGFMTLTVRAVAILGAIAVAAIFVSGVTKRSVRRLDLILVLAAIGIVVASWVQISARADAARLDREIADAGEANVIEVLRTTETRTGALVRAGNELRAETNAEIELIIDGLWDDERLVLTASPDAIDDAQLAQIADRVALLREAEERARGTVDDQLQSEIEAIPAIETPLPDSARLVYVDAALNRVEDDRAHFHQRLALAADRLETTAELVDFLRANLDGFAFDDDTQQLTFADPALAATYDTYLAEIDATWTAEDALISAHEDGEIETVLALVEAAGTTP